MPQVSHRQHSTTDILKKANQHFQQAHYAQAEKLLNKFLKQHKKSGDAMQLLGLTKYRQQQSSRGLSWIKKAAALHPDNSNLLQNALIVFRENHDAKGMQWCFEHITKYPTDDVIILTELADYCRESPDTAAQAEILYQKLLQSDPNNLNYQNYLADSLSQQGKSQAAIDILNTLQQHPQFQLSSLLKLGAEYAALDNMTQSIDYYRQALALDQNHATTHAALGLALLSTEQFHESEFHLFRALISMADNDTLWSALANAYYHDPKKDPLDAYLKKIAAPHPSRVNFHYYYGNFLMGDFQYQDAIEVLKLGLEVAPDDVPLLRSIAGCYQKLAHGPLAYHYATQALEIDPNDAFSYMVLSSTYLTLLDQPDKAEEAIEQALRLEPDNPLALHQKGVHCIAKGDFAAGEHYFRETITKPGNTGEAYISLVRNRKYDSIDHEDVKIMESRLAADDTSENERRLILFALGKVYDECGLYDQAFAYYDQANKLTFSKLQFNRQDQVDFFDKIKAFFTADTIAEYAQYGSQDETPIFVIGTARSGSTLTETLIGSYPGVGIGRELNTMPTLIDTQIDGASLADKVINSVTPDNIKQLATEYIQQVRRLIDPKDQAPYQYITDKQPFNASITGLLAMLFPKAKFVFCERHPIDTCLSNYFQCYELANDHSYSLIESAHFYRNAHDLMDHWRTVIPTPIYTVNYEALTEDPEKISKALFEHLGFEWSADCLDFFKQKNVVTSSSLWQVRQPIYRSSSERWRNYEKHVGELINFFNITA